MRNIEIAVPSGLNSTEVERSIDTGLEEAGLKISLRGTLKQFPGCTHWHAKKRGKSGTLEVTLWPREYRVWITIQDGRTAEWIDEMLPEIQSVLERRLDANQST